MSGFENVNQSILDSTKWGVGGKVADVEEMKEDPLFQEIVDDIVAEKVAEELKKVKKPGAAERAQKIVSKKKELAAEA